MPYHIIAQGEEFCVAKEGEDQPIDGGCHATKEEAQQHLDALDANVGDAGAKSIDLDAWTEDVRCAFNDLFPNSPYQPVDVWVERVFDDKVIVTVSGDKYEVPYTFDANNEPQFAPADQWVKVEQVYVPVNDPPAADTETANGAGMPMADSMMADYAVKFLGTDSDEIEGYSMLWGSPQQPDASERRDYFTPETDRWQDKLPLPRPLTFHHGFDPVTKSDPVIGKVIWEEPDATGLKYRAKLRSTDGYGDYMKSLPERKQAVMLEGKSINWDAWEREQKQKAKAYDEYVKNLMLRVRSLIGQGALKTSSDAILQYVQRVPQPNGTNWVKVWAHAADALTPVPAEPRMRSVQQVQAAYKSIGIDLPLDTLTPKTKAAPQTGNGGAASSARTSGAGNAKAVPTSVGKPTSVGPQVEAKEMTREEILALMKEQREAEEKEAAAKAAEEKRIEELAEAKAQEKIAAFAKQNPRALFPAQGSGAHVSVASKYDDMKLEDLAFLAVVRGEAKSIGKSRGLDEELARALATKSIKAVEQNKLEAKALEDLFPHLDFAAKSNEVMQSTLAGYGDEWVPTNYGTQLWMLVRAKARLLQDGFIPDAEIPKGYESDTIPLESSTDFTFYNVAQAANEDGTMKTVPATIPSSKMGTGNRVITVGKAGARGYIAGELDEDSIIDAIPEARAKLERQLPPEIEFLLMNMDDTAATSNINGDGTPTSGADYTIGKGIIRNALKNASGANASDFAGSPTSAKIITLLNLMGTDGYLVWDDPTAVRGFCDYLTWSKLMSMSDLLTVANAGDQNATIVRGALPDGGIPIFGVRFYATTGVKKAQATGIRHSATNVEDGSDTKGRIIVVRGDQWKLRWKRRPKFETERVARADLTELIVTLRMGIGYFDNEASVMGYDIS